MKQILYIITVFLFVAFVYIHVLFHLKVNNLIELDNIQITGKEDFEEHCNKRLPFIANYCIHNINQTINLENFLSKYKSFEINIKDKKIKPTELFSLDNFLSMNNINFLNETELIEIISKNDHFLRPSFTFVKNYDIFLGKNCQTNFISQLNFRNFFYVSEGCVEIYLAPPKSSKYLNFSYNNVTFSNETKINPFDKDVQKTDSFDKIKPIKIKLSKGELLFVPSSWYISISFNELAILQCLHYRTMMNIVTLTPNYITYFYNKTINK